MYSQTLRQIVETAVTQITNTMQENTPIMAIPTSDWMQQLAGSHHPADYFLHPQAFPIFLLPWWIERSLTDEVDLELQTAVAYSSANGYYYIRLIDNLMDGDGEGDVNLLPALNLFHTEFQSSYMPFFPASHPFWQTFRSVWFRSGESALEDAGMTDLDATAFAQIAAHKVCAGKIPVTAVCYHHQRTDLIQPWSDFIDTLGCWHQMMNDLFDWHKDLSYGNNTFFLSEGARHKREAESIDEWVIREGFAWGCGLLHGWMQAMQTMALELNSPQMAAYLQQRQTLYAAKEAEVKAGFDGIQNLLFALQQAPVVEEPKPVSFDLETKWELELL